MFMYFIDETNEIWMCKMFECLNVCTYLLKYFSDYYT